MRIKTVVEYVPDRFDTLVNNELAKGAVLEHRGLLPPDIVGKSAHYAQLVLLDDPEEPAAPPDPMDLLRQVREACLRVPLNGCNPEGCPMFNWCEQLRRGGDPTDWVLPGEAQP